MIALLKRWFHHSKAPSYLSKSRIQKNRQWSRELGYDSGDW